MKLIIRILLLSVAVGLVFGGALALVIHLTAGSASPTRKASAYLRDVRDAKYSQAYDKLCSDPNLGSRESFVARLTQARSHGHGVKTFRLATTFTKETLHLGSSAGTVTFADGTTKSVTFDLATPEAPNADKCLLSYGDDLTG